MSEQMMMDTLESLALACEERAEQLSSTYATGEDTGTARSLSEIADILRGLALDCQA
ncbi:hypothetical protein [Streptomyces sp. UNOC14_S4]|uniref:hypothetical protein n=1 Tax=Streptomyces sp. UNOC14_S4 TaxID=2872340 RepID=UPI001E37AF4E|nr:hypothetical protein [Streptomyces sp. UNOC14_S4]MCC3766021.1 hypothetical protein [Streptomyces sp. UNOC14_S4]